MKWVPTAAAVIFIVAILLSGCALRPDSDVGKYTKALEVLL